jgi:hypothetical protein
MLIWDTFSLWQTVGPTYIILDYTTPKPLNHTIIAKPKEYGYTPEPKNKKDDGLAPTHCGNLS